jgi:hypothetical protein
VTDRTLVPPTTDERGAERHPAWGMIGASRVTHSPPGAVLFDSDVRHQHYVTVRISGAVRHRELNRDWVRSEKTDIEVAMSEAQWASFVSSMNVGNGVPCTIEFKRGEGRMPEMPYEPRLAESMAEVRGASDKALETIREAFDAYAAHKTKGKLDALKYTIANASPNMAFAAESLSEHAENVVQRARADIEAMVVAKAQQLGLDAGDLGNVSLLTSGEDR